MLQGTGGQVPFGAGMMRPIFAMDVVVDLVIESFGRL